MGPPDDRVEELFAAYLERVEQGDDASFDDVVAQNPELEDELRSAYSRWLSVSGLVDALGTRPPAPDSNDSRGVATDTAEPVGTASVAGVDDLLRELESTRGSEQRYDMVGEVAHGGMGAILEVRERALHRTLAMKVIRAPGGSGSQGAALGRFLEEAQVTSQLEHPGVLPVHELGLDASGRVYFTMPLVQGKTLAEVFVHVADESQGWTRVRALGVLQKVCETVAFAHERGVIHRDLKPANVMTGRFGEVYVMDWGLARVLGQPDSRDMRLRSNEDGSVQSVRTDESSSPLVTMEGDVLGTPAYMPPEQARGAVDTLDRRADVYAIGAILYHLLCGHAPYRHEGDRTSPRALLRALLAGPPPAVRTLDPSVAPELEAICRRAMMRDPQQRYADTLEMAEDLRAFLEGRVVRAHEAGPVAELRKWVLRNRALATALLGVVLLAFAGLAAVSYVQARRTQDVLSLSARQELEELVARADALWPALPEREDDYLRWLADADDLLAHLDEHRARLERTDDGEQTIAVSEASREVTDRWWRNQLEALISDLEALRDPERGLIEGVSTEHGWGVATRLERARIFEQRSRLDPEAQQAWDRAIASIADPAQCPQYGGLVIEPRVGLLPIGRDPDSGLWEFAHLMTGEPALRDAGGQLVIAETTGVVLVLVPGARFSMGSNERDPHALPNEQPRHTVELDPFLISKYEMTQGQWLYATGSNPSFYRAGRTWYGNPATLANPVEHVSWDDCVLVLERLDLCLPTEAQWEYVARAGSEGPWWSGEERGSLAGAGNVADGYARDNGGSIWPGFEEQLDDGHTSHATVGTYRANTFGLHDTLGNLWEWCHDVFGGYDTEVRFGDGARATGDVGPRVNRGGSFIFTAEAARSATRMPNSPETRSFNVGVRPAARLRARD